jgi:hypothetical protein
MAVDGRRLSLIVMFKLSWPFGNGFILFLLADLVSRHCILNFLQFGLRGWGVVDARQFQAFAADVGPPVRSRGVSIGWPRSPGLRPLPFSNPIR